MSEKREFIFPTECRENHPRLDSDEIIGIVNTAYSIFYRGLGILVIRKCSVCGNQYIELPTFVIYEG